MKLNQYMLRRIEQKIAKGNRSKWVFSVFGIVAIAWILIRVLPKPSRATYPCMKVAFPLATSFIVYFTGMVASIFLFKTVRKHLQSKKYLAASLFLMLALFMGITSLLNEPKQLRAEENASYDYSDPLGPNQPIGEAKGILPGRVVWIHNPDATNENCNSKKYGDGYFLDKNCDQTQVDRMLSEALLQLTDKASGEESWDGIFKYFNKNHEKGEVGYSSDETIFIKVNAVHAWSVNKDLSIRNDDSYGNVDTSPQAVMALLRQLVNVAGVPQENIYIGDPFTHVFKHCYDKWSAEFPNIHYITQWNDNNRFQLTESNKDPIVYSDQGTVLDKPVDKLYECIVNASYVINLPALKGHRWGGVTFFAKNHFGTHTGNSSAHLHPGLHRTNYDKPLRGEYKQYRVMVDLMAHKDLGGKTLLYFGDMLWGTSYEHDPPMKFRTAPFNNDWSSSILLSLDPVAISSVALDIYQNEIETEDLTTNPPRYGYVRFSAVDDYLHQAASSEWWPEGLQYDPEDDGQIMGSLGVHEHWNNSTDKQYSRNLGTGDGIELIAIEQIKETNAINFASDVNFRCYPNPVDDRMHISFKSESNEPVYLKVYSSKGQTVLSKKVQNAEQIDLSGIKAGYYRVEVQSKSMKMSQQILKK